MTIGELRKALSNYPNDMPVADGNLNDEVSWAVDSALKCEDDGGKYWVTCTKRKKGAVEILVLG